MKVERFDEAAAFRSQALPYLLENEAVNNLILGVSRTATGDTAYHEDFRGYVVRHHGRPVAAAVQTPPYNLILSAAETPEAVGALAGTVGSLPGVIGVTPWVDHFVAARPEKARRTMRQGVFALAEVVAVRPGVGDSRPASPSERDLLIAWQIAFQEEAIGESTPETAERIIDHRLEGPADSFGLWVHEVDGTVVSMSGHTGPTAHGIRIGPVYTPPEHRGNGYASRLVAAESQWLLDGGRRFCFLYTDLSNLTSNSIYRRIGYRQVAESAEYSFLS
jgi:predicted GNAT family acetyltransferase